MRRSYVVRAAVAALWALFLSATSAASEYVTYLHADVLGSPLLATDEQGQVVWQEEYEPWGARQVKAAAAATLSRGSAVWYTGKEEEASLGMYYYGARWYSPGVGAFAAIDPAAVTLENPRSFNRYVYANNNPVRYTDPSGETPLDVAFLVYDVGRFGMAVYSGVGVGAAALDVGMSVLGVLSPLPATGQVLKTARTAERVVGAARAAEHGRDAQRAVEGAAVAKSAGQLGREGEAVASAITGVGKNTQKFTVNGRSRIPDQVNTSNVSTRNPLHLTEVKNVNSQSFTRQLRDNVDLVGPGGRVDVLVRPNTKLSGPLRRANADPTNPINIRPEL